MKPDEFELSEAERTGYAALRTSDVPPAVLEDRIVASLRGRGLLRFGRRKVIAAGITAMLAIGGTLIALRPARRAVPRFMLLLYEGPDFDSTSSHVDEYVQWAREVRRSATPIDGEKLRGDGEALGGQPGQGAELAGFFVVETKDRAQAVEIARHCPHLKHRGQIVVRQIEN